MDSTAAHRVCGYNCPMIGTGADLERAGWRYRISPYLIAGIAATESSLGVASCATNKYNAFGLASCSTSTWVPAFYSWSDAYAFEARFLRSHWPSARTPWDLYGYAACSSCWASHVAAHIRNLFNKPPLVRYP